MASSQKHIVAFVLQAWGHTRPVANFCARAVKLRPHVTITFLTTDAFCDRLTKELARSFDDGDEHLAQRVRIVSVGALSHGFALEEVTPLFISAWTKLAAEEGLVCTASGVQFSPLPKPAALIVDFFAVNAAKHVKSVHGSDVKVYAWEAGDVYSLVHMFGPKDLGGRGDMAKEVEDELRKTGGQRDEVTLSITVTPRDGAVVRVPALPPMYEHEFFPQDFPFPTDLAVKIFPHVYNVLESVVDGLFLFSPESYQPEIIATVKEWYARTGRHAYAVGPLLPSASKATAMANELRQASEAKEVVSFLDETLKSSGEKSLLYMSFGSIFWPVNTPEKVWTFIDVVMELNIPFILSCASPLASVPDSFREKVKAYGKGILSAWAPQQLILEHPVTGWFVAHGGQNGLTEAISAGVPAILWPFGGDQPHNAVHVSENLKIGYELLEVRTGHGLKPIFRTGYTPVGSAEAIKREAREVLAKAFGEDGAGKREKLQVLRQSVNREWEQGGTSLRDAEHFLDSV